MFSINKRIVAVLSALIPPILAAIWSTVLSRATWAGWRFLYVGAICLAAVAAAYFVHLKPLKDLERPVLQLLTVLSEKPLKLGKKLQVRPRMNIMLVRRAWYRPMQKRLVVGWGSEMNSHPDVRFSCRADQGVAGEALRRGVPVLMSCEGVSRDTFRFTQRQADQTAHVTAVWSWPIYELDGKSNQTGNVVGVLNLDTLAVGAATKLTTSYEAFDTMLKRLAEVVSTIV